MKLTTISFFLVFGLMFLISIWIPIRNEDYCLFIGNIFFWTASILFGVKGWKHENHMRLSDNLKVVGFMEYYEIEVTRITNFKLDLNLFLPIITKEKSIQAVNSKRIVNILWLSMIAMIILAIIIENVC